MSSFILFTKDLPLSKNEGELRVYLEILATAVEDWKEVKEGSFAEVSKEIPYEEHELLVVFPSSVNTTITRVLGEFRDRVDLHPLIEPVLA